MAASVTAAAVTDDFLVFPGINVVGLQTLHPAKRQQYAANIEIFVFERLPDVQQMQRITCVQPRFYLLNGNGLHR